MSNVISFSLFADIESPEKGAGLYVKETSSISSIYHCMFYNCCSSTHSGGVYIDHCSIPIKYCCFHKCKAFDFVAIGFYGISDITNEFLYLSTDSCSTIPQSEKGNGGTIHISETISKISNLNSTNNILNHIATSENYLCEKSDIIFCNSINNQAPKEGVVIQLYDTPTNLISYSNFVSNSCGRLPLIRCVTLKFQSEVEVTKCNFALNNSPQIVTDSVTVTECYDDQSSTFGTNIQNQLQTLLYIETPLISCVYSQTQIHSIILHHFLPFISSFIFNHH